MPRVGGGGCVVEEAAEDGGCGLERADDGEGGVGDGGGGDGVEEGGGGYADLGSGYVAVPFGCLEGWCCGDGWIGIALVESGVVGHRVIPPNIPTR